MKRCKKNPSRLLFGVFFFPCFFCGALKVLLKKRLLVSPSYFPQFVRLASLSYVCVQVMIHLSFFLETLNYLLSFRYTVLSLDTHASCTSFNYYLCCSLFVSVCMYVYVVRVYDIEE